MEGRWSREHFALLTGEECDVWLLTEVHAKASLGGMQIYSTGELMGLGKSWAAVLSRADAEAQLDPHRATALVRIEGFDFMTSVLPWRSCGPSWPGSNLAEKMRITLDQLQGHISATTVWGGDWNQALEGREFVGTLAGRRRLLDMVEAAGLSVPTRSLSSRTPGHRSIDHIAVPVTWEVHSAYRVRAEVDGRRLSDHDAYVISVER
jgi:hypothetical protein